MYFFKVAPFCLEFGGGGGEVGGVDQIQVYVVELELLEGGFECGECRWVFRAGYFGGYEELGAWDAGLFDGLAELGFVAVDWEA